MFEKTLSKETAYQGHIFHIDVHRVELDDGASSVREIVAHGPAVAVLAQQADGRFILVRQFRKAVERVCLEVVAGNCDPGEEAIESARRELLEETGCTAARLEPLGTVFPSVGYCSEMITVFYAHVANGPGATNFDIDERIEPAIYAGSEIDTLIRKGELADGKTLAVWLLYKLRHV